MIKLNRPACPNLRALTTNYKHPDNKRVLIRASFNKCMYCESKITHVDYGDIEHIKPKSRYPLLEFEWSNLGFVCTLCNGAKRDKYDDRMPYINPYEEKPEDFIIAIGAILKDKKGNERGDLTITDIKLNRSDLVEKRMTTMESVDKAIKACMRTTNESLKRSALEALKLECKEDKEYSLAIKTLLQAHKLV